MTPEQKAERDRYAGEHYSSGGTPGSWERGWQDCIDSLHSSILFVPEGYFRVGEEVEILDGKEWRPGVVWVRLPFKKGKPLCDPPSFDSNRVRRRPAWEPQDGEAVFVYKIIAYNPLDLDRTVSVGKYKYTDREGYVHGIFADGSTFRLNREHMKPFDVSKIGKPWSEL